MALSPVSLKSRFVSTLTGLMALGVGIAGSPAISHAEQPWPSQVQAVYRIEFNGFDIGSFEFNSNVSGTSYTLGGDAKLSALLGAFQWKALTRSSGGLVADQPRPANYKFDFAGTGKSGAIHMGFAGDTISNLSISPARPPEPNIVPVREPHLKGVLDPLSAVMAMARGDSANPCGRRLSVFDGRQRFDLTLSYKRQERIAEQRPSGQPGVAFVCKVRYTPIAGHKASDETRAMAQSHEIEIALRPIPSANIFIPHLISIPTGAGTARLIAQQVRIITRNEQIAFAQ